MQRGNIMKIYKIEFLNYVEIIKTKCYPEGKDFTQEDFDQFFNEDEDLDSIDCYNEKGNVIYTQWHEGEWVRQYYNNKNECVKSICENGNIYYPLGEHAILKGVNNEDI